MSKRLEALERALAELEQEGRLSGEQRELVVQRLREVWSARRVDFASVVAAFGGVLVAAGLLYLVGYNWEALGKLAKLVLVFGVWLGLHFAGWRLAERGEYPRLGRAFTLAGVLAFGGALGLVAQIYNLSSHYPNAVLLWWTLSIPIALVTRSRAVLVAVLALALLWTAWHAGVWLDDQPNDRERDWLANLPLLGAAWAALLCALVALCERTSYADFAEVLRKPIVPLAAAAPFVLAFHEPWHGQPSWWAQASEAGDPALSEHLERLKPVWVACSVAALALGAASARTRAPHVRIGFGLLVATVLLALLTLLAPSWLPLVANIALFGGALTAIALATRLERASLASSGVLLFLAGVVARYFEYLWDKLEGAYAFLSTGALLLGVAWVFEQRRRSTRARAQESKP